MRTLAEHIEKAFPQERLPSEEEIEAFVQGYETGAESDQLEAAQIRKTLVPTYERRSLTLASPDFIFYADGNLLQFLLGTYLLTIFEGEVKQVAFHDREDYLSCLTTMLLVSGPTWPYRERPSNLDEQFVSQFADLTLYQCCVVAECVRYCAENLKDPTDKWHCKKAVEIYWGVFPPMSDWPRTW